MSQSKLIQMRPQQNSTKTVQQARVVVMMVRHQPVVLRRAA